MDLLLCLESILSDFRHLFNQQNFALFQAFIFGFIANRGNGTLTELYQSSASETKYWSFPKFLSRPQSPEAFKTVSVFLRLYNRLDARNSEDHQNTINKGGK